MVSSSSRTKQRCHVRRLGARHAEELLDDPVQPLGLLDLDLDEFVLRVAGPIVVPQDLGRPADRAERVADLVRQHRRHFPQGRELSARRSCSSMAMMRSDCGCSLW